MDVKNRRFRYANLMSTIAVFLALGGGAWAVAASTSTTTTTITACADKKTGELRLANKCKKSEKKLSWNQVGPVGAVGPAGPKGDPGTPGSDAQFNGATAGGALSGTYPNPGLADLGVTGAKIANSTITGGKIAATTITGSNLVNNTVTGAQVDESTLNLPSSVSGSGGDSFAQQIANGNSAQLTVGTHTARITCGPAGPSVGATLQFDGPGGETVIWQSQVQGAPAALLATAVMDPINVDVPATIQTDRGARAVFTANTSDGGNLTTVVVEVITNWAGGSNCLGRAHIYTGA